MPQLDFDAVGIFSEMTQVALWGQEMSVDCTSPDVLAGRETLENYGGCHANVDCVSGFCCYTKRVFDTSSGGACGHGVKNEKSGDG